jgi:hypothetical protein
MEMMDLAGSPREDRPFAYRQLLPVVYLGPAVGHHQLLLGDATFIWRNQKSCASAAIQLPIVDSI